MINPAFQIVVLGCSGGPREDNLSGYLCSPLETQEWISLDAGSLLEGIECALKKKCLNDVSFTDPELAMQGEMLRKHLKCFLISHAHLDHIAGLVLNSPADSHKHILGLDPTIDNLRDHIFNGKIWPNYGSEGNDPILRLYEYVRLKTAQVTPIPNTSMNVEAFALSHPNGYPSSAFLIEYKNQYLLYIGDTSSDALEKEKRLSTIWKRITPLIKEKRLSGMFLECSYPAHEEKETRYGHLNSKLMLQELQALSDMAGSLKDLPIIVTHIKDSIKRGIAPKAQIQEELLSQNDLGIRFIFPSQGDRIVL